MTGCLALTIMCLCTGTAAADLPRFMCRPKNADSLSWPEARDEQKMPEASLPPQEAARAFIEANRNDGSRANFDLVFDDGAAVPPAEATLELDRRYAIIFVDKARHHLTARWSLRLEVRKDGSRLVYAFGPTDDASYDDDRTLGPDYRFFAAAVPYARAKRIADTAFWIAHVRGVLRPGRPGKGAVSCGDGVTSGRVRLLPGRGTKPLFDYGGPEAYRLADEEPLFQGSGTTIPADSQDAFRFKYLAAWLWATAKALPDAAPKPAAGAARDALVRTLLADYTPDFKRVSPGLVVLAATAAGEDALTNELARLRAIRTDPPDLPHEPTPEEIKAEITALEAELTKPELALVTIHRSGTSWNPFTRAKDWVTNKLAERAMKRREERQRRRHVLYREENRARGQGFRDRDAFKAPVARAVLKLETGTDAAALAARYLADPTNACWAARRLRKADPAMYNRVLCTIIRRRQVESALCQELYERLDATNRLVLARESDPDDRGPFAIPFFMALAADPAPMPDEARRVAALLKFLETDPARPSSYDSAWFQKHERLAMLKFDAIRALAPPGNPRRFNEPEIDPALARYCRDRVEARAEEWRSGSCDRQSPDAAALALALRDAPGAWDAAMNVLTNIPPTAPEGPDGMDALASFLVLARRHPETYRPKLLEFLRAQLVATRLLPGAVFAAVLLGDFRELTPQLEPLAEKDRNDRISYSYGITPIPLAGRQFWLVKQILDYWREPDPAKRQSLARALRKQYRVAGLLKLTGDVSALENRPQ